MSTLKMTVADCTTGEVIERDMTEEELVRFATVHAENEARRVAEEEAAQASAALKASARAKLVAGEPLTEEEAATIVL